MAKNEDKIPERFRKLVKPILMRNEKIISSFKESIRLDAPFYPNWLVLTNLRLLVLIKEIPGIRVDEYHLPGMTLELFKDDFGVYNSVEFLLNEKSVYQLPVLHKRWEEAEAFVHEVSKCIELLNFELRSESDNPKNNPENPGVQANPEEQTKCLNEKRHLRDLKIMGVITDKEYKEDVNKPC